MDVGATFCRSTAPTCAAVPRAPALPVRGDGRAASSRGPARRPRGAVPGDVALAPRPDPRLASGTARGWVVLDDAIGQHDRAAIEVALRDMAAEGLLERDADGALRARLPIANAAAAG